MGQSRDLKKGEWVVALGHPGGYAAAARRPAASAGSCRQPTLIPTDCTLVGGDSGGPCSTSTARSSASTAASAARSPTTSRRRSTRFGYVYAGASRWRRRTASRSTPWSSWAGRPRKEGEADEGRSARPSPRKPLQVVSASRPCRTRPTRSISPARNSTRTCGSKTPSTRSWRRTTTGRPRTRRTPASSTRRIATRRSRSSRSRSPRARPARFG